MIDDAHIESEAAAESESDEIIVPAPRSAQRARWAEIILLFFLAAFAVLAVAANRYAYFQWDLALARDIQSVSLPAFGSAMAGVSLMGNGWIAFALVVVAGVGLIVATLRTEGILLMTSAGTGWLVNRLWKLFIGRPRPSDALVHVAAAYRHESFPSGHVVFFVEFFGFLFFLSYVLLERSTLRRAALVVLGLPILAVGVSRVYLGAHWPSDVIGAYLAGGLWLMLTIEVYRRIKASSYRRQPRS
jgi:membrane-associated phospholipid phosphatase